MTRCTIAKIAHQDSRRVLGLGSARGDLIDAFQMPCAYEHMVLHKRVGLLPVLVSASRQHQMKGKWSRKQERPAVSARSNAGDGSSPAIVKHYRGLHPLNSIRPFFSFDPVGSL